MRVHVHSQPSQPTRNTCLTSRFSFTCYMYVCFISVSLSVSSTSDLEEVFHVPYSRESPPKGAASYFLTKQGGGRSFECFRIQP